MSKIGRKVKYFIGGSLIVPVAGLLAHMSGHLSENFFGDDYSLSRRFECAYSFNTPDSHRYYEIRPTVKGFQYAPAHKTPYWASPWATYPAMVILGLAGAATEFNKAKTRDLFRRSGNKRTK